MSAAVSRARRSRRQTKRSSFQHSHAPVTTLNVAPAAAVAAWYVLRGSGQQARAARPELRRPGLLLVGDDHVEVGQACAPQQRSVTAMSSSTIVAPVGSRAVCNTPRGTSRRPPPQEPAACAPRDIRRHGSVRRDPARHALRQGHSTTARAADSRKASADHHRSAARRGDWLRARRRTDRNARTGAGRAHRCDSSRRS
jgi:hypothetical protein